MRKFVSLFLGWWMAVAPSTDAAPSGGKVPYGRSGVFVVEEQDPGDRKITTYSHGEKPGPGKSITVRADSNRPAIFLVVAFALKDSRFLQDLDPLVVERKKGFAEVAFPDLSLADARPWNFEKAEERGELFVLVFSPEDKRLIDLRKLIDSVADAKTEDRRRLFANKLHVLLSTWAGQQAKTEIKAPFRPTPAAATFRGNAPFRWQMENPFKQTLPEEGPAIFQFEIGPEKDGRAAESE